jgi:hypothetical protein
MRKISISANMQKAERGYDRLFSDTVKVNPSSKKAVSEMKMND